MSNIPNLEENQKTIYRNKNGRIIDPIQTKEAKEKELENLNQENVSENIHFYHNQYKIIKNLLL
jgi:hypothetical protein